MARQHWVNLEDKNDFSGSGVPNSHQMGPVRVTIPFQNNLPITFKVRAKLVSNGRQVIYTNGEVGRNSAFKEAQGVPRTNNDAETTSAEVNLSAAGGNEYVIEAQDSANNLVSAPFNVESWRGLFYQSFLAGKVDFTAAELDALMGKVEAYFQKLFITLEYRGGGAIPGPAIASAGMKGARDPLMRAVKVAYNQHIKSCEPWAFAVVVVDLLSFPKTLKLKLENSPNLTAGPQLLPWSSSSVVYKLPVETYLWHGFDPVDDAKNGGRGTWLVDKRKTTWHCDGQTIDILPGAIEKIKTSPGAPGYDAIKIELPPAALDRWHRKKGRIVSWVNVAKTMFGCSMPDYNVIMVAVRCSTKPRTRAEIEDELLKTIIHEIGHKIGMLPEGVGAQLDALPTQYVNCGHWGSHCKSGALQYQNQEWTGVPGCVMFGGFTWDATGKAVSGGPEFCAACTEQVRKLDLFNCLSQSVSRFV